MLTKLSNEAAASEKGGFVLAGFGGGTTTVTFIPAQNGDDAFVVVEEEFDDKTKRETEASLSPLGEVNSVSSNVQLLEDLGHLHNDGLGHLHNGDIYADFIQEEFVPSDRGGHSSTNQQIANRRGDFGEVSLIDTSHHIAPINGQYVKSDHYAKKRIVSTDTNGEIDTPYIHDLK